MLEKYFISELSALLHSFITGDILKTTLTYCVWPGQIKKEMSDGIINSQIEIKPQDLEHQSILLEKQATSRQPNKVLSEN